MTDETQVRVEDLKRSRGTLVFGFWLEVLEEREAGEIRAKAYARARAQLAYGQLRPRAL